MTELAPKSDIEALDDIAGPKCGVAQTARYANGTRVAIRGGYGRMSIAAMQASYLEQYGAPVTLPDVPCLRRPMP